MLLNAIILMTPPQGGNSNPYSMYIMMGSLILVFYFFMIRPQSKKAKEQKDFHANIQKGEKVVTIGGLHGRIKQVNDTNLEIEIANNVIVTVERASISMENTKALQKDSAKP